MSPLIQQRHDRAVFYGLVDGIDINKPAEFGRVALFLLHQRRPGKAELAGLWEHPLHSRMHLAVLAAMALVNQKENVGRFVVVVTNIQGSVEFVDDRRDDGRLFPGDETKEMPA